MYRAKDYTLNTIKENPELKEDIEEEYYKLLIKIAKNKYSDADLRNYYFKVKFLINRQ